MTSTTSTPTTAAARARHRLAVSGLFLINGYVVGSWAPKIPELGARLAIPESVLGLMILVFGIGSLCMMPLMGPLIARYGSARPVKVAAVLLVPILLLVSLAPSIVTASMALFLLGGFAGAMDIAMNANAVQVERRLGRAIMSSCHGFWSLGGFIGSAGGGALIAAVGDRWHGVIVAVVGGALLAALWSRIYEDRPLPDAPHHPVRLPRSLLPYLVGLMALFSMVPEGAVLDWGALYLRQAFDAPVVTSGLAFGAFAAMMAVTRFAGDAVRNRLGAMATLRVSALIAFVGILAAGLAPNAAIAIAGFAFAGIGIANMAPIAFSAAGNLPGLAPGIGLSLVTTMGYSGLLAAPPMIGIVAEHTGFSPVFIALAFLLVAVFAGSAAARHADLPRS